MSSKNWLYKTKNLSSLCCSPQRFTQSTERATTVSETQAEQGMNRRCLKGIYKERTVLRCDMSYLAISCGCCAHRTGSKQSCSPEVGPKSSFVPDQSTNRRSGPSLHLTGTTPTSSGFCFLVCKTLCVRQCVCVCVCVCVCWKVRGSDGVDFGLEQ